MLTVRATISETPPDHRGGYDLPTEKIEAEAPGYDEALGRLEARVPEGWRMLSIEVDR